MVLRLTSCSPRRSGSFVTVVSGYGFVRARSGRLASVKLDAGVEASEPHDFTVRFSISRQHAVRPLTGLINPPCHHVARPMLPRPPHPVPYVRDDRETPLCGTGR